MKNYILALLLSFAALTSFAAPPARVQQQEVRINGPVGSAQSLVFNKTRKEVLTAVLKLNTFYQWSYGSITGPTITGIVNFNYQNSQTVLGVTTVDSNNVSIEYGPGITPSAVLFNRYSEIVLDPNTLEGTGALVIPVYTAGSVSYDTVNYTVVQVADFFVVATLEYTTGR